MPSQTVYGLSGPMYTVLGVVLGALLSGCISLLHLYISNHFQNRRHMREIMFRAAVDSWKQDAAIKAEKLKAGLPFQEPAPLDHYIIHLVKLSEVMDDGDMTVDNIADKIKRVRSVTAAAAKALKATEGIN